MNKFDLFWKAVLDADSLVEKIDAKFGRYGTFSIDNADILIRLWLTENVDPSVAAVTWMNETTFRFYSEANPNTPRNPEDDFEKYDVGPFQLNVRLLKQNIENRFLNFKGLDLARVIGTKAPLFDGDPFENARAAARMLNRIGRAEIVGPKKVVLYPGLNAEQWNKLTEPERNERRVVAYTGPDARPSRQKSWREFGPVFSKFFEMYDS